MKGRIGGACGTVVAGACCLGFTPLLGALGALGLGFLVRDAILIPLFLGFIALTLWSLWRSRRRHGRAGPFHLGLASGVVAFAALWFLAPLSYVALAAFVAATVWDVVLSRRPGETGGDAAGAPG